MMLCFFLQVTLDLSLNIMLTFTLNDAINLINLYHMTDTLLLVHFERTLYAVQCKWIELLVLYMNESQLIYYRV